MFLQPRAQLQFSMSIFTSMASGMCPKPCSSFGSRINVGLRSRCLPGCFKLSFSVGEQGTSFANAVCQLVLFAPLVTLVSWPVRFSCVHVIWYSGQAGGEKQLTTTPQVSSWCDSVPHSALVWGRFPRFPQPCSGCGAPSFGVSCLDFPELFLPRAQLQLSSSFCVPLLEVSGMCSFLVLFLTSTSLHLFLGPRCVPR